MRKIILEEDYINRTGKGEIMNKVKVTKEGSEKKVVLYKNLEIGTPFVFKTSPNYIQIKTDEGHVNENFVHFPVDKRSGNDPVIIVKKAELIWSLE